MPPLRVTNRPGASCAWPQTPSAGFLSPSPPLSRSSIIQNLPQSLCAISCLLHTTAWRAAISPRSAQRTSNERNSCQEKVRSSTQTQTHIQDSRSIDSFKESLSLRDTQEEEKKKGKNPFYCTEMNTDLSNSSPFLA